MDLLLRHNGANHKRETIAFSKRHQSVIERAAWLLAWRNYCKPISERRGGPTPAMRLGIESHGWSVEELLRARRFVSRIGLPECWRDYYWRGIGTPGIRHPQRHALKRAR